jgi:Mrp family chromosome partitioning ATPase
VARADRTTRDAIIAANQRFSGDRTRVLGTVLNRWDPKRSSYGYYGQNRYYGAYRYSYAAASPDHEG